MIKSNYNFKSIDEEKKLLNKKLLRPEIDKTAPEVSAIDEEIALNKPAFTPDDYASKKQSLITGGNYSDDKETASIDKSVLDNTDDSKSTISKDGDKALSVAGGAMGMATTIMSQKGPMNRNERAGMTMNLASQGAKAGSVFGPKGTAVGALVGAGAGLVMGIGDQKELERKKETDRLAMLDATTDKRLKAQKLRDGEDVVSKRKAVLEAQMGMLGSKY